MAFTCFIWLAEHPRRADKSAVCAINRHLLVAGFICHSAYSAHTDDLIHWLKSIIGGLDSFVIVHIRPIRTT